MDNNDLLQQGVELVTKGNIEQASIVLAQVVKENPKSEQGWLWLGRCQTLPNEKRYCFNMVLSINPDNRDAQYELINVADLEKSQLPPSVTSTLTPHTLEQSSPLLVSETDQTAHPPKKNRVRLAIYLLVGIMVGLNLGRNIANSLAASGFFDNIDNAITAKIIQVPEINISPNSSVESIDGTPTHSSNESFEKRLEQAWPLITQADALLRTQKYSEAITTWTQALAIVPEYAKGYYQRGASYYYLTGAQRAKSEYDYYLQLAIKDVDQAIYRPQCWRLLLNAWANI